MHFTHLCGVLAFGRADTLQGAGDFSNSFTSHNTIKCFFFPRGTSHLIMADILFSCGLDMAYGHFDNDVLEVLKVKAYFYNDDKSIFRQTRDNWSNCQKKISFILNSIMSLLNFHTFIFFLSPGARSRQHLHITRKNLHHQIHTIFLLESLPQSSL